MSCSPVTVTIMKRHKALLAVLVSSALLAAACASSTPATEASDTCDLVSFTDCLTQEPVGAVPTDVRALTGIQATSEFPGYSKTATVLGFRLIATESVGDAFLENISDVITSMFDPSTGDPTAQDQIITELYRHGATIPVVPEGFEVDPSLFAIAGPVSVCDIIMETDQRQVMEVVEHILHFTTDIGLHTTNPDDWGLTNSSALWVSMQEAIVNGACVTSSYDDIPSPARERIQLQEFAYWAISSYWDLQTSYGPTEDEWTARTPNELQAQVPSAVILIESTLDGVVNPPAPDSLTALDS